MTATADISAWMVHTATLSRLTGRAVTGPTYADPVEVACLIIDKHTQVRTATGETVISPTAVHMPDGTPHIPLGSLVTLPSLFGGRTAEVIETAVHSTGLGTPDHVTARLA